MYFVSPRILEVSSIMEFTSFKKKKDVAGSSKSSSSSSRGGGGGVKVVTP